LALTRGGNKQAWDQRILGDGEFVEQLLSEMDELGKEKLRLASGRMDLAWLAHRVCEVHGIWMGELGSGSRGQEILEAHRVLSWLAVKQLAYWGAEVARTLGVTNSCPTRAASAGKARSMKKYV
jgi:hypothetical protein